MNEQNYKEYLQIAQKITNNDERCSDLMHDVLIQLESNQKWIIMDDKERKYFFIKAITNQFRSNNSKFQRTYRKFKFETNIPEEQIDTIYQEKPSLEWVNETLDKELKENPNKWYEIGLFRMYMDHKKITPIHDKTKIPKYSIRNTLRDMKLWLNKKWQDQYGTN
jgi:hypothetical protein